MEAGKIVLPGKVGRILGRLACAGFEAYAVGGCVRDSILGRQPKDWDITTSAMPVQVKSLFSRTVDTGEKHGTVTVLLGNEGFEVTTYRIDGAYEDARRPKEVTYTKTLLEDLKRRDFTINAMAYNEQDGLIDAFDGMGDLKRGLIRCVGGARQRFAEDALRILRTVRFAAELGFSIEEGTREAACGMAENLRKISAERIQAELVRILTSDHPMHMRTLYEMGISRVILPEFDDMMQTKEAQEEDAQTVGEHTLAVLSEVEADKALRLAALLHDAAKPACRTICADGTYSFVGHEERGSRMAGDILRRLKFDNDTTRMVCRLVLWHGDCPPLTESFVRRAIVRHGREAYPALFALKRADALAKSGAERGARLACLKEYEACCRRIFDAGHCLSIRDLAINGDDLIRAGLSPGPKMGQALQELFELVLDAPEKNEREWLLSKIGIS